MLLPPSTPAKRRKPARQERRISGANCSHRALALLADDLTSVAGTSWPGGKGGRLDL